MPRAAWRQAARVAAPPPRSAQHPPAAGDAPATLSARLAGVRMRTRALGEALTGALKLRTERERLTAHPAFVELTARLDGALAVDAWEPLRTTSAMYTAPPAAGQLEQAADGLRALQGELAAMTAEALALGDAVEADRLDAARDRAARLVAKTAPVDTSALLASESWRGIMAGLGEALRAEPSALEAAKLALAGSDNPIVSAALAELELVRSIHFPCEDFQQDPVGFARTVLGLEPWSRQVEILELVRDNPQTAIASGHRTGKTTTQAILSLWFYCSFPEARVVATSPTDRQLNEVYYRAVRTMIAGSGRCLKCRTENPRGPRPCPHSAIITGKISETAIGGARAADGRQIIGFTSKNAEGAQGIAGPNLMFLVDEASGVDDEIFSAISGSMAGGGRLVLTGNPTRPIGRFAEAFGKRSKSYKTLTISSFESPNVVEGRDVIKGLATREWIDMMRTEYGEDSPFWKVRVLGEFAIGEDGKLFSIQLIDEATARWEDTPAEGELVIGVDVAGPEGAGDESAFAVRRGQKILTLVTRRGLDEEGHLREIVALTNAHRLNSEIVSVLIDADGVIGSRIAGHVESRAKALALDVVRVRGSDYSTDQRFDRKRDFAIYSAAAWLRAGGAIPPDLKLQTELHLIDMTATQVGYLEKQKATSKREIRKMLKRSTDRLDAFVLAVFDADGTLRRQADAAIADLALGDGDDLEGLSGRGGALDPYAGLDAWRAE